MKEFFDDNTAREGHGRKSLRGGILSVASRGVNIFVQVGSQVWVARLLSPDDVGLVAMITILTGLAPVLMDLGTRDASVQREKITHEEVSALFWLTMGIGGLLASLLVAGSPLISAFYNEPRLESIAVFSAINFILSAASCQHFALLRRAMRFQQIAVIEVGSSVVSSVASVAMAFAGAGYWALAVKPVLSALGMLVGACWCCRWIPGIPRLTQGVKEMIRFGLNITGFTTADYLGRVADRVAVGKRAGPTELGYYQNAFFVYDNALTLMAISLHSVAVASLSKLRDNVPELKRYWAKALSSLAFYAMPVFAVLAVMGEDLIVILLGKKWLFTGTIVSVLALRGIPHVVERTLGWLHVPAGRSDRWMRWGLFGSAVQIVALFCGLPFGTLGVAGAYTITMYLLFIPAIAYAGQPLGIGARDVIRVVGPQLVGALASAAAGTALRFGVLQDVHMFIRLPVLLAVCAVVYLVVVVGLFRVREPIEVGLVALRDFAPRLAARFPGLKFGVAAGKKD